jgi:N-acetylmuramoyl-L-alanine amidase
MPTYPKNAKDLGQTPNNSGPFGKGEPKFLVMHYTAGGDGEESAKYLHKPHKPASSAHFVIDRDGSVIQISDTNRVTWHAGKSFWRGVSGLNGHAIGLEIANYGYWRTGIKPATQAQAESAGWLKARHKNGGGELLWEPYPEAQMAAVEELTAWILTTHPTIREIVGHDDISPGRKSDPGPAFPMERFQDLLHPMDSSPATTTTKSGEYKVNAATLNVRGGPGTTFDLVKPALKKGALVTLLSEKADWSFIRTKAGKEGWVFSQYITPT